MYWKLEKVYINSLRRRLIIALSSLSMAFAVVPYFQGIVYVKSNAFFNILYKNAHFRKYLEKKLFYGLIYITKTVR